jgi:hypothetical protein
MLTLTKANEIWLKLHDLYDGTRNIYEQKHRLVLDNSNERN